MFHRKDLQTAFLSILLLCVGSPDVTAQELLKGTETVPAAVPSPDGDFSTIPLEKIPPNTIIIKGAEPSASDRSTPLPEGGSVSKNVYQNRYLGLSYPLPEDWVEPYKGPPPTEHGSYVLAQLIPSAGFKRAVKGTVLITAQDMFFAMTPTRNAVELVKFSRDHLPDYYEVERPPTEVTIAGRKFTRFDYKSPVADLHWFILATEIRCHTVQFVFNSQDTKLLEEMIEGMGRMQLPEEANTNSGKGGGPAPLCIAGYAKPANIIEKVDPVLADRRFNQIPVRIIIGKDGRVRHVHTISAFEDQAKTITDALMQWIFKPYKRDGEAIEVETGIMFRSLKTIEEVKPATTISD